MVKLVTSKMKIRTVVKNAVNEIAKDHSKEAPRIIVDMSFNRCMTEKQLNSLHAQINLIFGKNKQAFFPSSISLVEIAKETEAYLEKVGGQQWKSQHLNYTTDVLEEHIKAYKDGEIIYLSADSENTLKHIDSNMTILVGGLVDRNEHKNLCLERANKLGIKTAKLDLQEYLSRRNEGIEKGQPRFFNKRVLNTNHVVGIINDYVATSRWDVAFDLNIPRRKERERKKIASSEDDEEEEVGGNSKSLYYHNYKTVLITGGSSGIGLSFAKYYLNQKNYNIILVARSEKNLKQIVSNFRQTLLQTVPNSPPLILYFSGDCSNRNFCRRLRSVLDTYFITLDQVILSNGTFLWDYEVCGNESTSEYLYKQNALSKAYIIDSILKFVHPTLQIYVPSPNLPQLLSSFYGFLTSDMKRLKKAGNFLYWKYSNHWQRNS